MDFVNDSKVYDINDQYMFGPAILVNPVVEPITNGKDVARTVYLPECAGWYDFWTGEKFDGGQSIEVDSPLSTMPLYVKAGSIIPMGPFIQYATEKTDPIELRVYPGADASFTLYEDENDNYNYEKGVYSTIEFIWDDSEKTLTIGSRQGEFPGLKMQRTINIVIISTGHGVEVAPEEAPDRTVSYDGDSLTLVME
jgi:alpha-D-xyloside xylohydrolase